MTTRQDGLEVAMRQQTGRLRQRIDVQFGRLQGDQRRKRVLRLMTSIAGISERLAIMERIDMSGELTRAEMSNNQKMITRALDDHDAHEAKLAALAEELEERELELRALQKEPA